MTVRNEWKRFDRSFYPGFLARFPGGGSAIGFASVYAPFRESPMAILGADQQKLQFTVAQSITDRGYMNSDAIRGGTKAWCMGMRERPVPGQICLASPELR